MNIEEKFENLKSKQKQVNSLKSEIQKESSTIFDEYCKFLFETHPRLKSFGWNQYTPYFNDGSTCVFSANTDYLKINGDYVDESVWISKVNIINYGKWNSSKKVYEGRIEEPNPSYDQELSEIVEKIIDFLNQFDNDFYLHKFGDHCEVLITPQGSIIDEFDHE